MTRATLLALSIATWWVNPSHAQTPPPTPVPVIPPTATTPPIPVPPPPPPPPAWVPADPVGPVPVLPPVAIIPAPRSLVPGGAGFIAGLEIDVLGPALHGNLNGVVSVAGLPVPVSLPMSGLDWTGSPKVEIGYRLADNLGALSASYRSIVSSGSDNITGFDPSGLADLRTRLNANIVDLDYIGPHECLAPLWELDWRAGIRIAAIYYDTRATGFFVEGRTSNNFVGAGPHVGAEVARSLELPGLAWFVGLDGALVFAGTDQNFEQIFLLPDGTRVGGAAHTSGGTTAPVLTYRTGVSYTPPAGALRWTRFSFGYQFEQWWNIGRSQGDLNVQGLFFRAEFKF
jgi:hypothetical protein